MPLREPAVTGSGPAAAPELVCPADSLRALQAAVDAGADAVYLGLKDGTNARNFAGLNFDDAQIREGVAYEHARGVQVLMALNTFADARDDSPWRRLVDGELALGADPLIVANTAVLAHCRDHPPAAAAPVGAGLKNMLDAISPLLPAWALADDVRP